MADIQGVIAAIEVLFWQAYLDAVTEMANATPYDDLLAAFNSGRDDLALDLMQVNPRSFLPVAEFQRRAYVEGGRGIFSAQGEVRNYVTGARHVPTFDFTQPRSDFWLRTNSARMVQGISDDMRDGLRQIMADGRVAGWTPTKMARTMVGVRNKRTGNREGGVLGLTSRQMAATERARDELLSGDKSKLRAYLRRRRRDRRFDGTVRKAINEGKQITSAQADRMVARYNDRLLRLRAERIANFETRAAANAGAYEAMNQLVDQGVVRPEQIRKTWRHSGSLNPRHGHLKLNGESVGLNEVFINPDTGVRLRHPQDTEAPASEIVSCGCFMDIRIDKRPNR